MKNKQDEMKFTDGQLWFITIISIIGILITILTNG